LINIQSGDEEKTTLLQKALKYRWLIFWLLALGYILVYFHRLCTAVVAVDMMKDLKADGTLLGLLGGAYFYPYALMQLPAGLLSDSWGPRKTVTTFFLVAIFGSVLLAMAPTATWAIIGRTLVGIGVAMLFVPTLKILSHWFDKKEFATMTGLLVAMGGIGTLSATTPLALLSNQLGWRASFIIVGGFTLVVALFIWRFVRDYPSEMGLPSPVKHNKQDMPKISLKAGIKKVLTSSGFWPLGLWFFFTCAIFFSYAGLWGGPFLMQVYKLKKAPAGNVLAMMAIGMIIGSPLLSWLSNKVFNSRKPIIIIAGIISLLITGTFALFTDSLSLPVLYTLTFGLGVFNNAIVVIGFTTAKELFPISIAGTATGLVNFFPFAAGALFQPFLGYVLEKSGKVGKVFSITGYRKMFLILTISSLMAVIFSFFIKETGKE